MTIRNHLATLAFAIIFQAAAAATPFPEKIVEAISDGTISMPTPALSDSHFKAFTYDEGGVSKYLLEYVIGSNSRQSTTSTSTRFRGSLWLGVRAAYDLTADRHSIDLYLDRVAPTPVNIWIGDSDGLDVQLSLIGVDLLAGGGFMSLEDVDFSLVAEGDLGTHGDLAELLPGQSLVPCLDITCSVGVRLNLVYLDYQPVGSTALLNLNPDDQRSLVYTQFRDYALDPSWYLRQTFDVTPEPATLVLVLQVLCVAFLVRRR